MTAVARRVLFECRHRLTGFPTPGCVQWEQDEVVGEKTVCPTCGGEYAFPVEFLDDRVLDTPPQSLVPPEQVPEGVGGEGDIPEGPIDLLAPQTKRKRGRPPKVRPPEETIPVDLPDPDEIQGEEQ